MTRNTDYRYQLGSALEVSNIYPKLYVKTFYEQIKALSLVRCGWTGSQKYASLLWSGDVPSTFESLKDQISAGLNTGLAGIPWWTTDIGGFMTDDVADEDFKELLLRWFEFAVFSPILRMHGDRGPHDIPPLLRTMFYEFPEDPHCWELEDQYMFGNQYLVAPILQLGLREREVYLPTGDWKNISDNRVYEGKQTIICPAPLECIPVFERLS